MTVTHEAHPGHRQSFLTRYIFSQDHKIIGLQYLFTSLFMAVVGGFLAMLIRMQLGFPTAKFYWAQWLFPGGFANNQIKPDFYLAVVTMHGTIMIFFVLTTALSGGFGNFLIPLQIGARDMAFPFMNMLSYWLYPPAIVVLLLSFFVSGGAPNAGWTSYPPLSALPNAAPGSGLGQTLWLISLAILIVAFLFGSLNYITTILQLRARGMSLLRMPLTIWGLLFTAILMLLSFPVLFAAAIMLLFDRLGGTSFFVPAGLVVGNTVIQHAGGSPLLWQHLFWFLGHPEVYVLILPPMGIVSEVLATHARKPIFGYPFMVGSMAAISFLSFVVWGHHMFVSGMHPLVGMAFMTTTLAIAIPSAVKTFNWLATLWRARIRFTTAMMFAIGFISLFVTGGLTGIFLGSPAIDIYVHDTYFVVAHFHFVMASAALFGIFAGTYHWFPKMFGRFMNERLGKWHFWLTFVGIYLTFFPMHFAGIAGMMRRIFSTGLYAHLQGLAWVNIFISLAAFMLGAAQLLFIWNLFASLVRGQRAPANPWGATTLEWQTSSPPPHGNFPGALPEVHRWPYDYSVPGAPEDFIPQTVPVTAVPAPVHGGSGEGPPGGKGQ
ncbi:MAG: cbb3-type cytochrome c oxidase subunit I, partial [Armatimonadota bacterium]|nr:cbb3-type cytochrome c oxidase subunit I [Armatimonadota bacterium]MDR7468318.1 cbb3-type cytochrome c oxidase subunit I [Armatimonadota bacterium]MDR7492621.1 cbb3-type cytochrome c oxidase subunit I [Armatimonadota bacterium]MDR7547451.1 cbb3-type cytochrome c oxidase subunit I [Armatimonadota bacterium]MDR7552814.1 cbb3-type cytochrome c oxidase subunit I [Armatimonadota bacterium]